MCILCANMTSEKEKTNEKDDDKTPLILNGNFFKIHKTNGNNVEAICCICKLHYKGFLNATSNFSKHLKTVSFQK